MTTPSYETPRKNIASILHAYGLRNGVGVEIGVKKGLFSKVLLDTWDCTQLILVDPWMDQENTTYDEKHDHTTDLADCLSNLKGYEGRYRILRGLSHEVVHNIPDGLLDFVYVDGNHGYEAVKRDLRDWYPKLKVGGIMAGDDYTINSEEIIFSYAFGVKRAVDEFALLQKKNVSVNLTGDWMYRFNTKDTGEEFMLPSRNWWFVK
tara:strand:- start:808 stop:1425 length:618 start_codon:yes stop_codon:yes gene_type:complete